MKRLTNRNLPALAIALALLAGCARSEEASLVQPDSKEGYNQVGKVGSPEADDREPAIGQWRASLQENVQALEFGPVGTEPLVSLLCNGKTSVLLQRHGGAPAGPLPAMQIAKGELNEQLPVSAGGGAVPMLRAQVALPSPLADIIASGGEPLMIRLDDGPPLVLPPSALIGDYLRSCSTAQPLAVSQGGTAAGQTGNSAVAAPAPAASGNGTAPAPAANNAQPK
jgi:hypothetical protein